MTSCPWCPDFRSVPGRSDRMCLDCAAKLNPPRYVARLRTPPVYLGAHHHWEQEERHATRFASVEDAADAMIALGFVASDFVVELAKNGHGTPAASVV